MNSTVINRVLLQTDFPELSLHARGKVRDLYSLNGQLLFVATDRISAFDYVLATGIPEKGRVLTQLSLFWFDFLRDTVKNHLLTAGVNAYPAALKKYSEQLRGRSMLVSKAQMIDVECVVRGYLSGSGWKDYQARSEVCGHQLPAGLRASDRLPDAIFTPATKAQTGHYENITRERAAALVGAARAEEVERCSIALYRFAADYALARGIIIADTKFEFGVDPGGQLVLADEVLTPDSSRFWPVDGYAAGRPQPSFDKQFVRDFCEQTGWDKTPPGPALPEEVVNGTRARYVEAFERLTGRRFDDYVADPTAPLWPKG